MPIQKNDVRDVVFLHGWGFSAGVWSELAGRLAPRFHVHVPDLPGYGAAPVCAPYTLEAMAGAVARAAPPRCQVIGWSLGGQVALAWAKSASQQVVRLALIAATPCFTQRADWPHAVTAEALDGFMKGIVADRAGMLRRFISLQAQGDGKAKQVARQLRAAHAARNLPALEALAGGLRILLESDLRDALGSIRQPVLVMHGDRDSLVPLEAGDYLSRRLFNARLLVLRGAAHAPFLSKPEETSAALRRFFDE
ncbi:MAG: pimeloyl-ACP methyl ester esterase BioH [Burkholderiales bacterium]